MSKSKVIFVVVTILGFSFLSCGAQEKIDDLNSSFSMDSPKKWHLISDEHTLLGEGQIYKRSEDSRKANERLKDRINNTNSAGPKFPILISKYKNKYDGVNPSIEIDFTSTWKLNSPEKVLSHYLKVYKDQLIDFQFIKIENTSCKIFGKNSAIGKFSNSYISESGKKYTEINTLWVVFLDNGDFFTFITVCSPKNCQENEKDFKQIFSTFRIDGKNFGEEGCNIFEKLFSYQK